MDEKRAMQRPDAGERHEEGGPPGLGEDLTLKAEEIVFPVPDDHPLAKHQRLIPVESLEDVAEFDFVKQGKCLQMAATKDPCGVVQPPATGVHARGVLPDSMLLTLAQHMGPKLQLKIADFIVSPGTTVVMSNALNEIIAGKVQIAGLLKATGNLTITCQELRGGSGCVDVIPPSNGADGTDFGTTAAPAAPPAAAAGTDAGLFVGPTAGGAGSGGLAGRTGGDGGPGADGGTFSATVDVLGPDLCVMVSGGNGGRGGNGQAGGPGGTGGKGGAGFLTGGGAAGGTGGTGAAGGNGGNGGAGGRGGRISIALTTDASAGTTVLTANGGAGGAPGAGGLGGTGGSGGAGGAGGSISFGANGANGASGAAGPTGTGGRAGANGLTGTVSFVQRP
jgi:hypothetical protein